MNTYFFIFSVCTFYTSRHISTPFVFSVLLFFFCTSLISLCNFFIFLLVLFFNFSIFLIEKETGEKTDSFDLVSTAYRHESKCSFGCKSKMPRCVFMIVLRLAKR